VFNFLKNIRWASLTASWKTTLTGVGAIAIGSYQAYMGPDGISGAIHDPAVLGLFATGVIGLLAKDGNVTGGTKGQPSTISALADANQAPATGSDRPKAS